MPIPINISASRSSAILGLSGYQTKLDVWLQIMESRTPGFCEKHKYTLPEFQENAACRWGHAFESAVIELAQQETQGKIINREVVRNKNDYTTCHIDGEYDNLTVGHEGKTTSIMYYRDNFGDPGTDKIPLPYQCQVQHQLLCCPDWLRVILSVLVFPKRVDQWEEMGWEVKTGYVGANLEYFICQKEIDGIKTSNWAHTLNQMGYFHQYEIEPHEKLQAKMLEKYREFWEVNILDGVMPDPTSYDDIKSVYTEPVGTVVATPEIEAMMNEYKDIKSEISDSGDLAKKCDMLKTATLEFMRISDNCIDDDSRDKTILLSQDGKKLCQYGKNKKGSYIFR